MSPPDSPSESDPQGRSGSACCRRRLAQPDAVDSVRKAPLAIAQPAQQSNGGKS